MSPNKPILTPCQVTTVYSKYSSLMEHTSPDTLGLTSQWMKKHLVESKKSLDFPDTVRLLLQVVAGREVAQPDGKLEVLVDQQL